MLDVFFVVHGEGRRLCANVRPHRDRRRERVLVDSTSELMAGGIVNVVFVSVTGPGVTGPGMPWQNGPTVGMNASTAIDHTVCLRAKSTSKFLRLEFGGTVCAVCADGAV